ncbi:MAG: DUF4199 domain-containing protein [Vicingaceae bacterium]
MKSTFSIAVWMMVVSVLLKMITYSNGWQFTDYERIAIFGNVFVLMTGVFLGIRLFKKNAVEQTNFLDDFKAGMRVSAMYAILMTAFVYLYYSTIDPTYFDLKLKKQLILANENEMDLEQVRKTGEFVLTPFFQSTITLIGFLLLGSFYSGIITFLVRKLRGFND